MKLIARAGLPLFTLLLALTGAACGPPSDPEVVALSYVRATSGGDPDTAVQLLDIERIADRVEQEIVVVDSSGKETFLEDSIETLLWGLFRETRPADYIYDATPAELDGDTARVPVTRTAADETSEVIVVHLRETDRGWRVSGESLDPLVSFVVQRLQERYSH
jgi:hypothetical protein